MDLNLLTLGTSMLAGGLDAISQASAPIPDEFQNILEMTQAPPGPEPPPPTPDNTGEKELQTQESNTQSNQPDLTSTDKTQSTSDKDKKTSQTHAIATGVAVALPTVLLSAAACNNALPSPTAGKATAKGTLPSDGKSSPVSSTSSATAGTKGDPNMVSLKELPTDASATIVSTQVSSDPTAAQPPTITAALPVTNATVDAIVSATPDAGVAPVPQLASNAAVQQTMAVIETAKDNGFSLPTATSNNNTPSVPAPASVQNNIVQAQQAATSGGQTSSGNNSSGQSSNNQNAQTNQQANLDVIKQFADHTDKLALVKSAENVTVHLQSEDNTNVTLNIKSTRGEVAAQIVTNNESLRSALHQNRSQLNHSFENKGMNLGQVSVGLNGDGSKQQNGPQQRFSTGTTSSGAKETTKFAPGAFPIAGAGKGVDLSI